MNDFEYEFDYDEYDNVNNLLPIIINYIESTYNAFVTISFDPIYADELDEDESENIHTTITVNFNLMGQIEFTIEIDYLDILNIYECTGLDNTLDEVTHRIDCEIFYFTKRLFYKLF